MTARAKIDELFSDDTLGNVKESKDLDRIIAIPWRDANALGEMVAKPLTERLRRPRGTMTLRPLQALALAEATDFGGALIGMGVGAGKTLVCFLLPKIIDSKRALLLVPAKLVDKTYRDFEVLAHHWHGSPPRVVSYEKISNRPGVLEELSPDLLVCDEAHKIKNPKAAVTRRVARFLRANQATKFVAMSATFTTRSFFDWWHIQQWCLPESLQPLPVSYKQCEAWSEALDEKRSIYRGLGALTAFSDGVPSMQKVREGFGKRLRSTPGVVITESAGLTSRLIINVVDVKLSAIDDDIKKMRQTWATPSGRGFSEAVDLWRHARELGNGFFYEWSPQPPAPWLAARSKYHQFVRRVMHGSRTLDTVSQAAQRFKNERAVTDWLQIKDSFRPNNVAVWITSAIIERAAQWANDNDGLIWVEHTAMGQALDNLGVPYYGQRGESKTGRSIDDEDGPATVSVRAVGEGFNLQRYHKNLVLNATPKGSVWQQMLGRTQRDGQRHKTVTCDVWCAVDEQRQGFEQARADAHYIERITGQAQLLCNAKITNSDLEIA